MEDAEGNEDVAGYSQCQEAVKRLTEFLSHELQPGEEEKVQRHLQECRGCFARFHFEETLLRTIRQRADAMRAPGGLREKILSLIARPKEDTHEDPKDTRDQDG